MCAFIMFYFVVIGHVDKKHCSKLLDPIGRFQTLPLLHKQPITEQIQLFSYHNYNGVLYKGCLRYVDPFAEVNLRIIDKC